MEIKFYRFKNLGHLQKIVFYFFVASLSLFFAVGLFTWLVLFNYLNIFSTKSISYSYFIVLPIPAFAFVALIVRWANSLKLAKLKILFLMLGLNVLGMAPALFVSSFNARLLIIAVLSSAGIFLAFVVSNALWKFLKGKADFYFRILCAVFCIPFVVSAYFFGIGFQGRVAAKIFHSKPDASADMCAVSDNSVLPYWESARAEILNRYGFCNFSKELDSVKKCRFKKTKDGGKSLSFGLRRWGAIVFFGTGGAQDIEESNLYFGNAGTLLPCGKSGGDEYVRASFKSTAGGGWSATAEISVYSGSKIIKKYQLAGDEVVKKVADAEARIREIEAMWRAGSQKRK